MQADERPRPFDVEAALNALPLLEAPDLKGAVLAELAGRRPAPRRRLPALLLGLGLSTAAALLLVVLTRQGGPTRPLSSGTFAPQGAAAWPLVKRLEARDGAVTVRSQGYRFAFFLEATGKEAPSLHWDPAQWERQGEGSNPIILRHLGGSGGVSLWADGREFMVIPAPPGP